MWEVLAGLYVLQVAPSQIVQFMSNMFGDPTFFGMGRPSMHLQCSFVCHGWLHSLNLKVHPMVDFSATAVTLKEYRTCPPGAGGERLLEEH